MVSELMAAEMAKKEKQTGKNGAYGYVQYDQPGVVSPGDKKHSCDPAVYTFPTVKPIDRVLIEEVSRSFELVVCVEEHNIVGGFGSAIAEVMAEMKQKKAYLLRIGLDDRYSVRVGNQMYLRSQYGMDSKAIVEQIEESL